MIKNISLILIFILLPMFIWGQTNLVVQNGNLVLEDGFLVLENSNIVNNASVNGTDGTVLFSGNSATDNSVGGTMSCNIPSLILSPIGHNVVLDQNLTVSNTLRMQSGLLDIKNSDLRYTNTLGKNFSNDSNSYIKTSGTGIFERFVGNNATIFPVGNSSQNGLTIVNNGASDYIGVRVQDQILENLSSGDAYTKGAVNRVWHISEDKVGGLDLDVWFTWTANEELSDFDRTDSEFITYKNAKWESIGSATVGTRSPYSSSLVDVTESGAFTLASAVCGPDQGGILTATDTEAPSVTCEADITVSLDGDGNASIEVMDILKTSSDNCTPTNELMYALSQSDFRCDDVGEIVEVTLTVKDKANNENTCKTKVTVLDPNPGPQWGNCLDDQIKTIDPNKLTAYVEWDLLADLQPTGVCLTGGTVNLGLGGGVVQITDPDDKAFSSGNFPIGTTTVTYIVMGTNNRSSTCSFDIIVSGGCEANAGADKLDNCGDAVILAATAPVIGTGTWSVESGGGSPSFDDVNDPKTMFSGDMGETYVLKWALSCDMAESDEVTISFNPDSDNDTVQDCVDICNGGDDLVNTDGDNTPDACDCAPLTPDDDEVTVLGLPFLNNMVIDGSYFGQVKLTSNAMIPDKGKVSFIGGEMVHLKAGFHAQAGSDFIARLGYCIENPSIVPREKPLAAARNAPKPVANIVDPLKFSVGPNPFVDHTNLILDLPTADAISIAVYDQTGRMVQLLMKDQLLEKGHYQFKLTDQKLPAGIYFIRLSTSTEQVIKKVISIDTRTSNNND